jgi:translation initiation factor IF-2
MVVTGLIRRNASIRVIRDEETVFEGQVSSLKHLKDDEREIREGFECGIGIKGFTDFEEGDILESYTEETVAVE